MYLVWVVSCLRLATQRFLIHLTFYTYLKIIKTTFRNHHLNTFYVNMHSISPYTGVWEGWHSKSPQKSGCMSKIIRYVKARNFVKVLSMYFRKICFKQRCRFPQQALFPSWSENNVSIHHTHIFCIDNSPET